MTKIQKIQKYRREIDQIKDQINEIRTQVPIEHPLMIELKKKLNRVKHNLARLEREEVEGTVGLQSLFT
ncbi:hypothetical protein M0R19_04920 [Candidatus Pacearchaeota archaeon]|nr:hypothetical protein [Candidatus Pacearchaeota archaeon]